MNLQLGTTLPSLVESPLAAFDWWTVAVCAATKDAKTAAQKAAVRASAGVAPWPPDCWRGCASFPVDRLAMAAHLLMGPPPPLEQQFGRLRRQRTQLRSML